MRLTMIIVRPQVKQYYAKVPPMALPPSSVVLKILF